METDKYINISNQKELEAARKEIGARMKEQTDNLNRQYTAAKKFYSPENICRMAIKDTTTVVNWIPLALTMIRAIRRKIE